MARIFSECVILRSPETGEPAVFLPGSPVPGWAGKLVTNPAVTVEVPDEAPAGTNTGTEDGSTEPDSDPGTRVEDETETLEATSPVAVRPYGNATKNEWADYATGLGVQIPDGATKADIQALVEGV